jgi:ubiquinone/menaquinone biosynthesis C-methylase UbiE
MINEQVKTHFSQLAEDGVWTSLYADEGDRTTNESWSFLIRARRVIELIEESGVEPRSLLDVGCGTAPIARGVAAMGAHYTGVDFAPEMIEAAGRNIGDLVAQDRAALEIGDVTSLDFPEASFDVAIAMGVVEYLTPDQVRAALGEFRRVLRPGGVALVTIPKRHHWGEVVDIATYPLRKAVKARPGRKLRLEKQEQFRRLFLTVGELDLACSEAGLRKAGGRHYNVELACRPATLLAPHLCYYVNRPLEGLALAPVANFLATGYIGMYRKP